MLSFALVRALAWLVARLPLGAALAIGRGLASFAFHVLRLRRRVVLDNIRAAGVADSEAAVRRIGAEAYRQAAMTFIEVLRASSPRPSGLEQNVSYDPLDPFVELRARKAPVILIQGHIANFDLTAYAFAGRGFPHHTVMKGLKNARLERMIVATRERHGVTVHVKGAGTYDAIVGALRRGEWVGLLPDQRARRRPVTVDFLGRPARIFPGPAELHLDTGAAICIAIDERQADDPRRHHVRFSFLPAHPPGPDREADIQAIMQAIADALAVAIRRTPSQYFWFHRLWGKD